MANLLQNIIRIPVKNVKPKRIYQFSDTHLVEWDDLSSQDETVRASARTARWEKLRFEFASHYGEPCGQAQSLPAKTFFYELLETCKGGDALIMAGDIIDFDTHCNTRILDLALKDYPVPFVAVCGNHDEPDKLPEGHPMKAAGAPVQKLDLGDMVILGFDNSQRVITKAQNQAFQQALNEGKPVLVAMHIPIMTEGNWDKLQYCGEYFQLNYEGCPEENLQFIEMIKANADQIIAVTCGHLHFLNQSEICPGVVQYVSSQGIIGSYSIYEIGESI